MIAVILAAGKGSRLGEYTTDLPKSLLPLNAGNKTLLDYNIQVLSRFDLKKVYVVTGFNSHKIEKHLSGNQSIEIIYNPFWDCCNVLGSLYMALDTMNDDFLFCMQILLPFLKFGKNLLKSKVISCCPTREKDAVKKR